MINFTRINHVGIRIRNLEVARKFYESLGFRFSAGPLGPEPVAIMEHSSGVNINFIINGSPEHKDNVLMDKPVKYSGYTHMALEVESATQTEAALKKLGIPLTEGPIKTETGAVLLFIRDPDNNVIEFHQAN